MSSPHGRFIDHYKALGLEQTATADEIKSAYHEYALRYHPDRKHTEEERRGAIPIFQAASAAHSVLSDPAERRKYDAEYALNTVDQSYKARSSKSGSHFTTPPHLFNPHSQSGAAQKTHLTPAPNEPIMPDTRPLKPKFMTTPDFLIPHQSQHSYSGPAPYIGMSRVSFGHPGIEITPLTPSRFKHLNHRVEEKNRLGKISGTGSLGITPFASLNVINNTLYRLPESKSRKPQPFPRTAVQYAYNEAKSHHKNSKRAYTTSENEVTKALSILNTDDDVSDAKYKIDRYERSFEDFHHAAKRYGEVCSKHREPLEEWLGAPVLSEKTISEVEGKMEVEKEEVRKSAERWRIGVEAAEGRLRDEKGKSGVNGKSKDL